MRYSLVLLKRLVFCPGYHYDRVLYFTKKTFAAGSFRGPPSSVSDRIFGLLSNRILGHHPASVCRNRSSALHWVCPLYFFVVHDGVWRRHVYLCFVCRVRLFFHVVNALFCHPRRKGFSSFRPDNPVYARRLDLSVLAFCLSLHRHPLI